MSHSISKSLYFTEYQIPLIMDASMQIVKNVQLTSKNTLVLLLIEHYQQVISVKINK